MTTLIEEKDVTVVNLAVELEQAVIQHELQEDESIYVTEDGWFPFWIRVQDNGYVTFTTHTNFMRAASHVQRLELCNKLNADSFLVTFYVKGDKLYSDCIVNYRNGLLRETFIRACRQFTRALENGLTKVDAENTFVLLPGQIESEDEKAA